MSSLIDKAKEFMAEKIANIPMPEATIQDVDLKGVKREGASLHAKVGVSNPYSASIPICDIKYELRSGGSLILSGTIPDPGSLNAKETTVLDVPMLVPHNILMSLVKDLWTDWDIDYDLKIDLIIDLPVIGNFTIPLSTKGEIKLPTLGSIFGGGGDNEEDKKD